VGKRFTLISQEDHMWDLAKLTQVYQTDVTSGLTDA
jgi:sodium/potassium-transporting ATPase subunit alpha